MLEIMRKGIFMAILFVSMGLLAVFRGRGLDNRGTRFFMREGTESAGKIRKKNLR